MMKKYLYVIWILPVFFIGIFTFVTPVFSEQSEMDSITPSGNGNLLLDVNNNSSVTKDTIFVFDEFFDLSGADDSLIIGTSTVQYYVFYATNPQNVYLICGEYVFPRIPSIGIEIGEGTTLNGISYSASIHCSSDVRLVAGEGGSDVYYMIAYVPYDTRVTTDSSDFGHSSTTPLYVQSDIRYGDWLLLGSMVIFLLSFMTWGFFFSPFKKR